MSTYAILVLNIFVIENSESTCHRLHNMSSCDCKWLFRVTPTFSHFWGMDVSISSHFVWFVEYDFGVDDDETRHWAGSHPVFHWLGLNVSFPLKPLTQHDVAGDVACLNGATSQESVYVRMPLLTFCADVVNKKALLVGRCAPTEHLSASAIGKCYHRQLMFS